MIGVVHTPCMLHPNMWRNAVDCAAGQSAASTAVRRRTQCRALRWPARVLLPDLCCLLSAQTVCSGRCRKDQRRGDCPVGPLWPPPGLCTAAAARRAGCPGGAASVHVACFIQGTELQLSFSGSENRQKTASMPQASWRSNQQELTRTGAEVGRPLCPRGAKFLPSLLSNHCL